MAELNNRNTQSFTGVAIKTDPRQLDSETITVTTGATPPVHLAPDGSLFISSDNNGELWIRSGGAWVNVFPGAP